MSEVPCVDIINIGDDLEAVALRAMLERLGAVVRIWHVPSASMLVNLLNGQTTISKNVVMSCHGGPDGLHLPELAPEVAAQQPYNNLISAMQMQEFLHLPECTFINTGCCLGRQEFAQVFLHAGCEFYIGGNDYIDGNASLIYLSIFFYELLCGKHSVEEAHRRASSYDEETALFQLFASSMGTQR